MACTESAPPSTPLPSAAPSEPTATPPPVATPTLQPTPTPWAWPTATPRSTPTPTATSVTQSIDRPTPTPWPTATPCPGSCLIRFPQEVAKEPLAADVARSAVRIELKGSGYSAFVGSGVIVDTNSSTQTVHVVTGYHVIAKTNFDDFEASLVEQGAALTEPTGLWVTADDGLFVSDYKAEVVNYDSENDVALLSICCSNAFQAAKLSSESPTAWVSAFSIGFGRGETKARVTSGKAFGDPSATYIGFDAGIVPGDSGSPLFDGATGEVIGILLSGPVVRTELDSFQLSVIPLPDGSALGVTSRVVAGLLESAFAMFPTATPAPLLTPIAQACIPDQEPSLYLWNLLEIMIPLVEIFSNTTPSDFMLQPPLTLLVSAADDITAIRGVPCECWDFHTSDVLEIARLIYQYTEDQRSSTLTELLGLLITTMNDESSASPGMLTNIFSRC